VLLRLERRLSGTAQRLSIRDFSRRILRADAHLKPRTRHTPPSPLIVTIPFFRLVHYTNTSSWTWFTRFFRIYNH